MRKIFGYSSIYRTVFGALVSASVFSSAFGQKPTEPQTLKINRPVEREMTGAETHRYQFDLKANEFLQIRVEQKGLDVALKLTDVNGKTLATMDSPNSKNGPETLSFVADKAGIFILEVSGFDVKAETGIYSINSERIRPATLRDRRRVQVEKLFVEAVKTRNTNARTSLAIIRFQAALRGWKMLGDQYLIDLTAQQIKQLRDKPISDQAGKLLSIAIESVKEGSVKSKQTAILKFQAAANLYHKIRNSHDEAFSLGWIGYIYESLGENQKALDWDNRALVLRRIAEDSGGEAATLANIGAVYGNIGDQQRALSYFEQAMTLLIKVQDTDSQSTVLNNIGKAYNDLGERQKALDCYNQSLLLARQSGNPGGEGRTLSNIGAVYEATGEREKALEFYNQALVLRKKAGDKSGEANTLNNIGAIYADFGEKQKALDYYAQSLSLSRTVGDQTSEASTLNNIGAIYSDFGENKKALDFYNQALSLQKLTGDKSGEASSLNNIGAKYSDLGDNRKALELYTRSLEISRQINDRDSEISALINIGGITSDLGENQKALEIYNQALAISRQIDDKEGEAGCLTNLGTVYSDLDQNEKGLDFQDQALKIFRAIGDKEGEASSIKKIGNYYINFGENERGLEFYEQSLKISRTTGNKFQEAATLNIIGAVYSYLSEYEKALSYNNQSLSICRQTNNKSDEARTLNNKGLLYTDLGESPKAIDFYNESLRLSRLIGEKSLEGSILNNLGSAYRDLHEYQKALELHKQSLTISRQIGSKSSESVSLNNLGAIYDSLEDPQTAIDYYNRSLLLKKDIDDVEGEASALNNLGNSYDDLGQHQKAVDYYNQSLPLSRQVGNKSSETNTLNNLMYSWESLGNKQLAIFFGKLAVENYQETRLKIKGLDRIEQQTYLKKNQQSYRELADLLITSKRLSEAQQVLNSFKDQQFFDFDSLINNKNFHLSLTPQETTFLAGYENSINSLKTAGNRKELLKYKFFNQPQTQKEALEQSKLESDQNNALNNFRNLLRNAETVFSQLNDENNQISKTPDLILMQSTLGSISAMTGENAVAIYQLIGEDNFQTIIITPTSIKSVSRSIEGDELNEKAKQYWALLQSDTYDPSKLGKELYDLVFAPLEKQLPKETTTLMWSLDGNLRYLPMAALFDGRQYLAERFQNVVFTRADAERMTRRVSRIWTGTGFGTTRRQSVSMLGERLDFNALPGVGAELREIFKTPAGRAGIIEGEVLPDESFTRPKMLSSLREHRPLVHIASHFSFRPGDEARSFLLLGDGTAFALSEMKKETKMFEGVELLTLSACNTAAQRTDANGREIDGFAELAQRLGAGAVLATLWPVSDASTPRLMRDFYVAREGGMTKAKAIREAQLALLNGTAETGFLPEAEKGAALSKPKIVIIPKGGKRESRGQTRSDTIYLDEADAPPYKKDEKKPFAHPYYWSPFVLFGNWR